MNKCRNCIHRDVCKWLSRDDEFAEICYEYVPKGSVQVLTLCEQCLHFKTDTEYCKEHNKGYCEFDNTIKSRKHFCGYADMINLRGE